VGDLTGCEIALGLWGGRGCSRRRGRVIEPFARKAGEADDTRSSGPSAMWRVGELSVRRSHLDRAREVGSCAWPASPEDAFLGLTVIGSRFTHRSSARDGVVNTRHLASLMSVGTRAACSPPRAFRPGPNPYRVRRRRQRPFPVAVDEFVDDDSESVDSRTSWPTIRSARPKSSS
jgi:hypothetical protein